MAGSAVWIAAPGCHDAAPAKQGQTGADGRIKRILQILGVTAAERA
jgi:hypothetical protein